jgi:hypothetical protein
MGLAWNEFVHAPGSCGVDILVQDVQRLISPWTAQQHLALYHESRRLIDEVDPAVVILDTFLRPALDAARDSNRLHAFITPNQLIDNFVAK